MNLFNYLTWLDSSRMFLEKSKVIVVCNKIKLTTHLDNFSLKEEKEGVWVHNAQSHNVQSQNKTSKAQNVLRYKMSEVTKCQNSFMAKYDI